MTFARGSALAIIATLLVGCGSHPSRETATPRAADAPNRAAPFLAKPGYYLNDGPADVTPADLDAIPDANPRREPLHRFANRPYTVFGREYIPATTLRPYHETGIASWYGRKFHGQKTSNGETYDMFAMTAAHPTLPLPSFARVTNPTTDKAVVVRVNDRGPFLHDRVIDLSYAAAHRLGIAQKGSGEVQVEAILFDDVLANAAPALPSIVAGTASSPAQSEIGPIVSAQTVALAPATLSTILGGPSVSSAATPTPAAMVVATETVPITASAAGFVVQLGAFSSSANAQSFIARLANQLPRAGVEAQVRQVNGFFRVSVGPYATREHARNIAERLRTELGLPSFVLVH